MKQAVFGVLMGFFIAVMNISFARIMFPGPLESLIPMGINILLISCVVLMLITTCLSQLNCMVAGTTPIFVIFISEIALSMYEKGLSSYSTQMLAIQITAVIFFVGVLIAVSMYLVARFKLANIVRFMPSIVFEGFLAGIGVLFITGVFGDLLPQGIKNLESIAILIPSLLFMVLSYALRLRFNEPLSLMMAIFICVVGYYCYIYGVDMPLSDASQLYWLDAKRVTTDFPLLTENFWQSINWQVLLSYLPDYASIVFIFMISSLFNLSAIDLNAKQKININSEFALSSKASFFSTVFGGSPGHNLAALTLLCLSFDIRSRIVGFIAAGVCLFFLLFGFILINLFPKFVADGIALYLGTHLITMSLPSYLLCRDKESCLIMFSMMLSCYMWGFFVGTIVGLAIALIIFIIRYSKLEFIKARFSSTALPSNVERSEVEKLKLASLSDSTKVILLQGYLFFGNGYTLSQKIRQVILEARHKIKFLILDFQRVQGVEALVMKTLAQLVDEVRQDQVEVLITRLPKKILPVYEKLICQLKHYPSLDHALEFCEEQLLHGHLVKHEKGQGFQKDRVLNSKEITPILHKYARHLEIKQGVILDSQGESSNSFYWLENGVVEAIIDYQKPQQQRIYKVLSGTFIGEMGFFTDSKRSATLVTQARCLLYEIDQEVLEKIATSSPQDASKVYHVILSLLSNRLMHSNKLLKILYQ